MRRARRRKVAGRGIYDSPELREQFRQALPAVKRRYLQEWSQYNVSIDPDATDDDIIEGAVHYYGDDIGFDEALQESIHRRRIEH